MSTIAYRNGILAADSMAYGGKWCASPGAKWKIWRLDNGDRLGVTTCNVGAGEALRDWLNGGGDRTLVPTEGLKAILVKTNGEVHVAEASVLFSGPIEVEFYAIGSGADFAIGAMAMGASAVEGVSCACRHDQHTGGPIRWLGPEAEDG